MNIAPVMRELVPSQEVASSALPNQGNIDKGFSSFLSNSIAQVNDAMTTATEKSSELAVGKSENLHEAMIAFEKAETSFKLLM